MMWGVIPFAIKNSHKLQQRRVSVQLFSSSRVLLTSTYNLRQIPLDSPSAPFCHCLYSGLTPEVPAEIGSQCHQHHDIDTLQGETQDLPVASWVIHLESHRIDRMACKSLANWWCAHDHCLELQGNQSNILWNEVKGVRPLRSKVQFCHWYVMYCHVYVRWCEELSHLQSRTPTNSNKEECLFNSFSAQEYCWQARTICPKFHLTAPAYLSAAACTAGWPRKFLPR